MGLKSNAVMLVGCQQEQSLKIAVNKAFFFLITAEGWGGAHSQLLRLIPCPHGHYHRLMGLIPAASQEIYPTT